MASAATTPRPAGRNDRGWDHSVAGAVAGSTAVLLLHPFDVIKTRLQVQDGFQGQALGTYRGTIDAVRTILRTEGWRAFYNGLVPAWIGSGVAWSAYFTAYEAIKALHARGLKEGERLSTFSHTLSAAQAGAMVCLLTNPIWLIKTRLQLQKTAVAASTPEPPISAPPPPSGPAGKAGLPRQPLQGLDPTPPASASASGAARGVAQPGNMRGPTAGGGATVPPRISPGAAALPRGAGPGGQQYKGFMDALIRIGKEEGIRGYYKGLAPSLLLTTHGAIQFTVYEELKHLAARWGVSSKEAPDRQITALETSVAAAMSKLTASIVTYPTQVVRSRLQQRFDLGRTRQYKNTWDVVVKTWQGEGLRGFYKGLGPALIRVLPQSAITLVVYEHVLQAIRTALAVQHPSGGQAQGSPPIGNDVKR